MKVFRTVYAGLSLAIATSGLAQAQENEVDRVLAVVNGTEITLGHIIALRQELPEDYDQYSADVLYGALLEQLISQTALSPSVDTTAKRTKLTLENQRRSVLASIAVDRIAAEATTEEALRAAYDETYLQGEPESEMNASHILVETQEEAAAITEETRGGTDFAEVAKAKSTGPTGPAGGELGWFIKGQMVPEFEAAVLAMNVGEISDPVQTQFGWHVIKLNDVRELDPPAFEQVAGTLANSMANDAIEAAVAAATEAAEVVRTEAPVDPELLNQPELLDE